MADYHRRKTPTGYVEAYPRPDQAELDVFYREQYYRADVTATYQAQYTDDELRQKELRAAVIIEAIIQSSRSRESVAFLEIGSGEGFLLAEAMKQSWNCLGVDFQRMPVEKFNPGVLASFVEANPKDWLDERVRRQDKFSIVALQNVLEHALEPDRLMQNIASILEPGGLLFVQVPNDYSPIQDTAAANGLIDREYWFQPPQHLNYFNIRTLDSYAQSQGFDVVDMFSDFPVEFYLWGNQTNYIRDRTLGPLVHRARVELDLLMSASGIRKYLDFYRGLCGVGMGRNICAILRRS